MCLLSGIGEKKVSRKSSSTTTLLKTLVAFIRCSWMEGKCQASPSPKVTFPEGSYRTKGSHCLSKAQSYRTIEQLRWEGTEETSEHCLVQSSAQSRDNLREFAQSQEIRLLQYEISANSPMALILSHCTAVEV